MLIVKNLFSFYVEFEILLYFMCFRVFWEQKNMIVKNPNANEIKIVHGQQVTLHDDDKIS
jgi:hypothetical protein